MTKKLGKVVIAMSGGVDSSVAAALLKKQGYEVVGVMLQLWSEAGKESENKCCTLDSQSLAQQVASILEIPFHAINAKQIFRDTVVEYFLQGYIQGITPNPCIFCNKQMRWGYMLDLALDIGAEKIATGHYAKTSLGPNGTIQLLKAKDKEKDQSYFLYTLSQKELSRTIFPLADYTKEEVRLLAQKFGLPVAERQESQDLCFLGKSTTKDFLIRNAPEAIKPGLILNTSGKVLGEHDGLAFYTIGQRKGIGIAAPQPFYVVEKRIKDNTLIVGTIDELGKDELTASEVNWISGSPPPQTFRGQTKIRYKAREALSTITPQPNKRALVKFQKPLRDITPGQAAVFYVDEICLGGGIIQAQATK